MRFLVFILAMFLSVDAYAQTDITSIPKDLPHFAAGLFNVKAGLANTKVVVLGDSSVADSMAEPGQANSVGIIRAVQ